MFLILQTGKKPHPIFKVELEPEARVMKKNQITRFTIFRSFNIAGSGRGAAHKKPTFAMPGVCSVYVVCGDYHNCKPCPPIKQNPKPKKMRKLWEEPYSELQGLPNLQGSKE